MDPRSEQGRDRGDRVDPEWQAFVARVKPGVRLTAPAGRAESVAARCRDAGASLALTSHVRVGGELCDVVYAAWTGEDAAALQRLERPMLNGGRPVAPRPEQVRELGARLGFPACCVDAFVARNEGPQNTLASVVRHRLAGTSLYRSVRLGWAAAPPRRTNVVLLREGLSLLSFEPCRLDCDAALALADRHAELVRAVSPAFLSRLDAVLAQPVAVAPSGARALLSLDGSHVVAASPPVAQDGSTRALDARLARALPGVHVGARGRVRRWLRPPFVVVAPR